MRYRTGDLIEIISLRDDELDINTPQMRFHARADGVIDVAGFTRLTEKAIWEAIEESGIQYVDWVIQKSYSEGKPYLHLYLELSENGDHSEIEGKIHARLLEKDSGYSELEDMLDYFPLKVTQLPSNSFVDYTNYMRSSGAELAHLKPPRIDTSNEIILRLQNP